MLKRNFPSGTRGNFLKSGGLAIAGLALIPLSDCSGGTGAFVLTPPTSLTMKPPTFGNSQGLQQLMRTNGLLAIRQQGVAVVRDDMKMNAAFVKHATRRFPANPMTVEAPGMFQCSFQCVDGFQGEYDGVPIGPVTTAYAENVQWGFGIYYGDTIDAYLDWVFATNFDGNVFYSPVYTTAFNDTNCVESELKTISLAAGAIALYISKLIAAGKANAAVRALYIAYSAGELTLADFCIGALSALGVAACAEALADAGVVITISALLFAIYDTLKCAIT